MKIELSDPLSIFSQGKRDNMEDYIFPVSGAATQKDGLFIVCDGMGGHTKGEVASKLACETFSEYIAIHNTGNISEQILQNAFDHVQAAFDDYIARNPESKGMGTTVVLACFHDNGVAVLHCGDSRFYHFRGSELTWKTTDHSLVNEWLRQGLITKDEAVKHPKSNVITRAIQGKNVRLVKPEIHFINDLCADDYLLLCTDGIYEGVTDEQLTDIFGSNNDDHEKRMLIQMLCEGNSRDNFSAYLLKVKDIH